MGIDKTSKDVSTQQVDPAMAKESHALVNLFKNIGSAGPQVNRGVTIADFSPAQKAAFESTDAAAAAFGAPTSGGTGLPASEESASGILGFRPSVEGDAALAGLPKDARQDFSRFYRGIGRTKDYKQFKPSGSGGKK